MKGHFLELFASLGISVECAVDLLHLCHNWWNPISIISQPTIPAMKKLIFSFALLGVLPALAETPAEFYKQGLAAVEEGDVATARTAFNQVLRLQPGNANARYQLGQLKTNQGKLAARARENKLNDYVIEAVDFEEAEFSEALTALGMMIDKKSNGEFAPNFLIQDSTSKLGTQPITLNVKNVPAKAVFEMMLKQVGGTAKYDKYAIVVKPAPRTP